MLEKYQLEQKTMKYAAAKNKFCSCQRDPFIQNTLQSNDTYNFNSPSLIFFGIVSAMLYSQPYRTISPWI